MARPIKKGLDYFPLDVHIFENRKISRLKRKQGADGVLLYLRVLCNIYDNGYFLDIDEDQIFDFSELQHLSEETTSEMIKSMIELKLFDADLYQNQHILTSKSIQEHYVLAKKNIAKDQAISEELDLISDLKPTVTDSEPTVSGEESTQRKGKKSKPNLNQSTANENKQNLLLFSRENQNLNSNLTERVETGINDATECESNCGDGPVNLDYTFSGMCERIREKLKHDDEWLHSVVQQSGKGKEILDLLPEVLPFFENHIISSGETGTIKQVRDYKYRFISWWRCMKFQNVETILEQANGAANNRYGQRRMQTMEDLEEVARRNAKKTMELLKREGRL